MAAIIASHCKNLNKILGIDVESKSENRHLWPRGVVNSGTILPHII